MSFVSSSALPGACPGETTSISSCGNGSANTSAPFRKTLAALGLPDPAAARAFIALFDGFTLQKLADLEHPVTTESISDAAHALLTGYMVAAQQRTRSDSEQSDAGENQQHNPEPHSP